MWMGLHRQPAAGPGSSDWRTNRPRADRLGVTAPRAARIGTRSQTISSVLVGGAAPAATPAPGSHAPPGTCPTHHGERPVDDLLPAPHPFFAATGRSRTAVAGAVTGRRASATVARTSDSASCAASCASPLAAVRCPSLNDGAAISPWLAAWPSDAPGSQRPRHSAPHRAGPQRPQPFCHSRGIGIDPGCARTGAGTSSSKRSVL